MKIGEICYVLMYYLRMTLGSTLGFL